LTDEDVRREVIDRANGVCCHCGELFDVGDDLQICHIKRHDDGGTYDIDNLMYGHRSCDAAYDDGRIVHDPMGGYWLHKLYTSFKPDLQQLKHISEGNNLARWLWEKKERYDNVSDYEFREKLKERKFKFVR